MSDLDQCIVENCRQSWEEEFIKGLINKNHCSGFVKAVTKKLGIPIPETAIADDIVDTINISWKELISGSDAMQQAAAGILVLAGLKSADHKPASNQGHVAVVVSGKLCREKYLPVWGSTGGAKSQGEKSVGEVWNSIDRANVVYYAYTIPACNK
ncbi:MAG: hypothetical protein ACRERU_00450 [Methylococcales bacterium]